MVFADSVLGPPTRWKFSKRSPNIVKLSVVLSTVVVLWGGISGSRSSPDIIPASHAQLSRTASWMSSLPFSGSIGQKLRGQEILGCLTVKLMVVLLLLKMVTKILKTMIQTWDKVRKPLRQWEGQHHQLKPSRTRARFPIPTKRL